MKTFNSISKIALIGKINARTPDIIVAPNTYVKMSYVIDVKRHSETNIFLNAIRSDYLPTELVHIIRGFHAYAYDHGMTSVTPPRLGAREDTAMGHYWQVFADAHINYLADTLPSEADAYWESVQRMSKHTFAVLGRMLWMQGVI